MRTALKIGFCCVLLGGMIAALWYRHRANGRLVTEIESLRRQTSDLGVLQADNQRLIAAAPVRADAMRKKREELVRLEAQIITWRKQVEVMERRGASAVAQSRVTNDQVPSTVLAPGMMRSESMQNVGRTTPTLAMQTLFWAQNHANIPTIEEGVAFDPEAKVKLDALFAELSVAEQAHFGSPERLAAAVVAEANQNRGGGPGMPIQMIEKPQGPETVEVALRVQLPNGQLKDAKTLQLRRYPDGWKVMLPPEETDMLRTLLNGLPPAQRMRLGEK